MTRLGAALAALACLATPISMPAHAASLTPAQIARQAGELVQRDYRADAPGASVLVARGDRVLYRGASGEADVDRHLKLRPDSVFRIGSVSKQFAAAGLLKLVEAGKVKLGDPLSKYLPYYPGGARITLLQLLNHTAGISNYTALPGYMEGPIRRDLTTGQMIDVFKDQKPDFEPGSKWAYSNSGYVLVGAVIEAVTGEAWHAYLDRVLFRPLAMRHTGYGNDPEFAARQVHGYTHDGARIVPMRVLSMTQPHAAGALVSTVDDLFRWNRALHEGRVLKQASYAQMITPVGKAAEAGYGFGLFRDKLRGQVVLRHGGGIFGFVASLSYLPGPGISVVVLENDDGHEGPESADSLARRLAALAFGDPYPEMRPIAVDPASLQKAEGSYRFDSDTIRVLRLVDGKLSSQRSGAGRVVLTPIAADDYLYGDGFNRLKLERDEGGRIRGARFFPAGDGIGEFGLRISEIPPAAPVALQLPRGALERLVGTYAHGPLSLRIFLEGAVLEAQLAGQPAIALRASSPIRFDVGDSGAVLEFSAGEAAAAEVLMRQNGREMVLKR